MVGPRTRIFLSAVALVASVSVMAQRERGPWTSVARRVGTGSTSVLDNGLIQPSQIVFLGSFRMPAGVAMDFCTCAIAYDAADDALYIGTPNKETVQTGIANWAGVTKITIPTPVISSTLSSLNRATTIIADTDTLQGQLFNSRTLGGGSSSNITGLLVKGADLYINATAYYDADGTAPGSIYKRSKDLVSGAIAGPFTSNLTKSGFTAGYLADVPAERQASFGGDMMAGLWSVPIVTRESQGPAAFAFNASAVSSTPFTPSTLLFYPPVPGQGLNRGFCGAGQGHPLCIENNDIQLDYNPALSGGEALVVPSTYRSMLFLGGMGTGRWCYGVGTSTLALDGTPVGDGDYYCYDPERSAKGNHAQYNPLGGGGYKPYYWLYDDNDMIAVKEGAVTSYAPRPYAYGNLATIVSTYDALYAGEPGIKGAAYDATGNRIFVVADKQDGAGPIIHVLKIVPTVPPPPCTVSASGTRLTTTSGSICDAGFHVWSFGPGTSPARQVWRDGAWLDGGTGSEMLYYNGVIYIHGSDVPANWYTWIGTYNLFGPNDPEMGGSTPVGYFVSNSGNNSRTCMQATDPATPKLTIVNALGCVGAGDTLWVRGGNYPEMIHSQFFTMPQGTSWSNKVRIANYPGETVWMNPSGTDFVVYLGSSYNPQYIEFDGINMDGTNVNYFTFKNEAGPGYDAHHIRLQNAEIKGPTSTIAQAGSNIVSYKAPGNETGGGHNEYLNLTVHGGGTAAENQDHQFYIGTDSNLIQGNNVYAAAAYGIHIWNQNKNDGSMTFGPQNNVIRNNTVHDGVTGSAAGGGGILVGTDNNTQVYNNVVYAIMKTAGSTAGISAYASLGGALIYNNTVYGCPIFGIYIFSNSSTVTVRNNISYNNGVNYQNDAGASTTAGTNLFSGNPMFLDAGLFNFRLASTSSPAYNAGATVTTSTVNGTSVSSDKDGISRPQSSAFDIGAYEFH